MSGRPQEALHHERSSLLPQPVRARAGCVRLAGCSSAWRCPRSCWPYWPAGWSRCWPAAVDGGRYRQCVLRPGTGPAWRCGCCCGGLPVTRRSSPGRGLLPRLVYLLTARPGSPGACRRRNRSSGRSWRPTGCRLMSLKSLAARPRARASGSAAVLNWSPSGRDQAGLAHQRELAGLALDRDRPRRHEPVADDSGRSAGRDVS